MLVLMLEVQKCCNGVDINTCIEDKLLSELFTYPNNLQNKGVRITEDTLYLPYHACSLLLVYMPTQFMCYCNQCNQNYDKEMKRSDGLAKSVKSSGRQHINLCLVL